MNINTTTNSCSNTANHAASLLMLIVYSFQAVLYETGSRNTATISASFILAFLKGSRYDVSVFYWLHVFAG